MYNSDHDSDDPSVNTNLFTRISSNRTLRRFSLTGRTRFVSSISDLACEAVEFPSLEHIDLHCPLTSINPIASILESMTLPTLESLLISFDMSVKPTIPFENLGWLRFFSSIAKIPTNRFKDLTISSHSYAQEPASHWKDVGLTLSEFPDLDGLSLEKFNIKLPILHSVNLSDVQKTIKFWPGLRELSLKSCRPSKLGFGVLVDIALGLPNLSDLTLSIDIQELPIPDEIPLLGHSLCRLELEISSMPQPGIMEFAQCVDKIFPGLYFWGFSCSNYPNVQNEATQILNMLKRARGYEAKRASLRLKG